MVNHRVAFGQYQEFTETLRESLIYAFRYHNIPGNPEDVNFMVNSWNEVQPFTDTPPGLCEQKEKTKILIFSNVETEYLEMMVSKVDNFTPDFIGDMKQARTCKPSPRAYQWVLERAKLKVKDVLYCAAVQWDVQGALACGMKTVWLNRTEEKLEGIKPDYEVIDLYGVTELLGQPLFNPSDY
jgi:2-haloacid dehalogenase